MTRNDADAICQLLDRGHAALREGRFRDLADLAAALSGTIPDLSGLDAAQLTAVRTLAQRNAACLLAAGRGLRSARRRIAEIQTLAAGSTAYDRDGRRTEPSAGPRQMSRRF